MANTVPHAGAPQRWRNWVPFDWNHNCRDREPRGDWYASMADVNLLFMLVWDLNQRITTLEQNVSTGGNTNITPQLQSMTANLNTAVAALQSAIIPAQTHPMSVSHPANKTIHVRDDK